VVLERVLDKYERLIGTVGNDLAVVVDGKWAEETQHLLGGELCVSALGGCADFGVFPLLPVGKKNGNYRSVTLTA
jgi:hypothetical protein